MSHKSANRRAHTPHSPPPMAVRPEILRDCEHRLEPALKRRTRQILRPIIKAKFGLYDCGDGLHWGRGSQVKNAWFGHYCSFGVNVIFAGPAVIGDLSMLAHNVEIIGQDHLISTSQTPMRLAFPTTARPVTIIESECWIGCHAKLMEGVRIGRGSVVAAGAIVTKDVPPYSVVAGTPARLLRPRFSKENQRCHDRTLYGDTYA